MLLSVFSVTYAQQCPKVDDVYQDSKWTIPAGWQYSSSVNIKDDKRVAFDNVELSWGVPSMGQPWTLVTCNYTSWDHLAYLYIKQDANVVSITATQGVWSDHGMSDYAPFVTCISRPGNPEDCQWFNT